MLSAGLASSNLSWDFSLARRAASFTSLNCSANCRPNERGDRGHTQSQENLKTQHYNKRHTLQFTAEENQDKRDKICLVHSLNIVTADPCKYFFICQVFKLIVVIVILLLHHSNIHNKLYWTLT